MKKKLCCIFCHWTPVSIDNISEDIKYRVIDIKNDTYFAILDCSPKILGHTLVIAQDHYNDILDNQLHNDEKGSEINEKIFKGALKVARLLKERLGANKVYIVTMCEHWEGKDGSEHLHYHLIPQYKQKPVEGKDIVAEDLIARKGISIEQRWFKEILRQIADKINPDLKQIREQAILDN